MEDGQKKKAKEKRIPQLERNFRDFRTGVADASTVFEELEGKSAEIPTDINESKESFLLKYILTAVQDCYLKNADQDIILSAFGFLQGYENHGVQERHYEYCKWVGIRTKDGVELPLDIYWSKKDLHRQMNARENSAIKRLYKALVSKMSRNGGVLGYATDSNKIMEICSKTFPQPYYLQEEGYRKCSIDGRIFYIPLTPAELRVSVSSIRQSPTQDRPIVTADAAAMGQQDIPPVEEILPSKKEITLVPGEKGHLKVAVIPMEAWNTPLRAYPKINDGRVRSYAKQ